MEKDPALGEIVVVKVAGFYRRNFTILGYPQMILFLTWVLLKVGIINQLLAKAKLAILLKFLCTKFLLNSMLRNLTVF